MTHRINVWAQVRKLQKIGNNQVITVVQTAAGKLTNKVGTVELINDRLVVATRWTGLTKKFEGKRLLCNQVALAHDAMRWSTMSDTIIDYDNILRVEL